MFDGGFYDSPLSEPLRPQVPLPPGDGTFTLTLCTTRPRLQQMLAVLLQGGRALGISEDGMGDHAIDLLAALGWANAPTDSPCLDVDPNTCRDYRPDASLLSYFPHSPFDGSDVVPDGWAHRPWYTFNPDALYAPWVPQWFQQNLFGLQPGDVVTTVETLLSQAVYNPTSGFPTVEIAVRGGDAVEIELLEVPQGGLAVIWQDDGLGSILNAEFVELESESLTFDVGDLETLLELVFDGLAVFRSRVYERTITGTGLQKLKVMMLPNIGAGQIVGFGGGIRRVTVCGESQCPECPDDEYGDDDMIRVSPTDACQIQQSTDRGVTWVNVFRLDTCGTPGTDAPVPSYQFAGDKLAVIVNNSVVAISPPLSPKVDFEFSGDKLIAKVNNVVEAVSPPLTGVQGQQGAPGACPDDCEEVVNKPNINDNDSLCNAVFYTVGQAVLFAEELLKIHPSLQPNDAFDALLYQLDQIVLLAINPATYNAVRVLYDQTRDVPGDFATAGAELKNSRAKAREFLYCQGDVLQGDLAAWYLTGEADSTFTNPGVASLVSDIINTIPANQWNAWVGVGVLKPSPIDCSTYNCGDGEVISIPSNGQTVYTTEITESGADYRLTFSGTWDLGAFGATRYIADAFFITTNQWATQASYPVVINGTRNSYSVSYQDDHSYSITLTGTGQKFSFRCPDNNPGDNSGNLLVTVERL